MLSAKFSQCATALLTFILLVFLGGKELRAEDESPVEVIKTDDATGKSDPGSPAAAEPFKVSALELSVHGEGKVEVKVFWKVGKNDDKSDEARLNNVTPPFSFQWVVPPVEATGFVIVPISEEAPQTPVKWIPIEVVESGNAQESNLKLHEHSLYFPIPLAGGTAPKLMDNTYFEDKSKGDDPSLVPRRLQGRPQVPTGWTFMGIWNSETTRWRSLYWLEREGAASLRLRQFPLGSLPSGLAGRKLVANFPMRMRRNASAESEEVHGDVKLRPGTVVTVDEIAVEGVSADFRVWARITATGEQLIVNK